MWELKLTFTHRQAHFYCHSLDNEEWNVTNILHTLSSSRFQDNEVDKLHLHPVKHSCKTDRGAVVVERGREGGEREGGGERVGERGGWGGSYIVFNVCLVVVR